VECNHCEVLGPVEIQYVTQTQPLLVSRRDYNTVQSSTCNTLCINSLHWQAIKNTDVGPLESEKICCILSNVVGHVMSCHVTAADKYSLNNFML
jgi:hypothetical protein